MLETQSHSMLQCMNSHLCPGSFSERQSFWWETKTQSQPMAEAIWGPDLCQSPAWLLPDNDAEQWGNACFEDLGHCSSRLVICPILPSMGMNTARSGNEVSLTSDRDDAQYLPETLLSNISCPLLRKLRVLPLQVSSVFSLTLCPRLCVCLGHFSYCFGNKPLGFYCQNEFLLESISLNPR